jgi:hypothetical protein
LGDDKSGKLLAAGLTVKDFLRLLDPLFHGVGYGDEDATLIFICNVVGHHYERINAKSSVDQQRFHVHIAVPFSIVSDAREVTSSVASKTQFATIGLGLARRVTVDRAALPLESSHSRATFERQSRIKNRRTKNNLGGNLIDCLSDKYNHEHKGGYAELSIDLDRPAPPPRLEKYCNWRFSNQRHFGVRWC